MQKNYFHNDKSINENKKRLAQISNNETNRIVDINILLNRVKIEEKNEIKKKFLFFSFTIIALSLFGTFIALIK